MENLNISQLLTDAKSGMSCNKLMQKYKIGHPKLKKILEENNVIIVKSNRYTDDTFVNNIFEKIDTEEKAYWLGFIFADGFIAREDCSKKHKYTFEITLSEKDKSHLEKLKAFFNSKKELTKHRSKLKTKKDTASYRLSRQNKKLWTDLFNAGCHPNKSLILKFPSKDILPENLKIHFIRGYIDGDGCIVKNKKHDLAYIGICGSESFLIEIERIFGSGHWGFSGKIKTLSYSITKGIPILKQLYNNATTFLDRKYNIAMECIKNYTNKPRKPKKYRRKSNNQKQN